MGSASRHKMWPLLSAVLLLAALAGCGQGSSPATAPGEGARLNVVATIPQIRSMAEEVAGELATVRSILPPGADAHDFEPKPSDIQAIRESHLMLKNGIGLDDWVDRVIANAGGERPLVTVTEGIPLREGSGDEEHEGEAEEEAEEDEHGKDPHVWLDVTNAMTMTRNIRDALIQADPSHADAYRANAETYLQKLEELDRYIMDRIANIPPDQRKIVTNHESLGYYTERYGLTFVGSIIPSLSTEAEPSAQDVTDLVRKIRAENVKAIFLEGSTNPRLAQQIAADTGIKVVDNLYGDSMGEPGTPTGTYEGMMRHNTDVIVDALRD